MSQTVNLGYAVWAGGSGSLASDWITGYVYNAINGTISVANLVYGAPSSSTAYFDSSLGLPGTTYSTVGLGGTLSGTLDIESVVMEDGATYVLTGDLTTRAFDLTGFLTIDGTGATLDDINEAYITNEFIIGDDGDGSLTVIDGGTVSMSAEIIVAYGSSADATVSGVGSTLTSRSLAIGAAGGEGSLSVADGGSVSSDGIYIGYESRPVSGFGTITATGIQSIITSEYLYVGYAGSGSLSVLDDATVSVSDEILVGDAGSGTITVSGSGSTLTQSSASDVFYVGIGGDTSLTAVMTITDEGTVSTSGEMDIGYDSSGTVTLLDGTLDASNIVIYAPGEYGDPSAGDPDEFTNGGTISGSGLVDGDIENDNTIIATGCTLALTGVVTGTGTLMIGSNSNLTLSGSIAATQTVEFTGSTGTLTLDDPHDFQGSIIGVEAGDEILLPNSSIANGYGVIAATVIDLNGVQTLQIFEGSNNNPTVLLPNIPFADAAGDNNLVGKSLCLATSTDGTDTLLTVPSGGQPGLIINETLDGSVTSLTNAATLAGYEYAIQAADKFYENEFTNPVTINLSFEWGNAGGGVASNLPQWYQTNYSALYAAVKTTDTLLTSTDPTGDAPFAITTAEAKVLGLLPASTASDGYVVLNSSDPFSWSQSIVASGSYDATGALEHEISEELGRLDLAGTPRYGSAPGEYTLLDMFRYTAGDGLETDAPGSPVGERDEPFVANYLSGGGPLSPGEAGINAYSYFSYNGTTVTLPYDTPAEVNDADPNPRDPHADVADWTYDMVNGQPLVVGDSYGAAGPGQAGTVTATDLQEMEVLGYNPTTGTMLCFLAGTLIATPSNEVPVERITSGDLVLTACGEVRRIVWIGAGRVLATRGRRNAGTPVIVRKGALADNVPHRDLRVTKGHSLYIDGALIPVEFLVNHRSILWDDHAQEVSLYHIELDTHDVLLANGAPAESYRDDGNRWLFQNANSGWDLLPQEPCAPVLTGGSLVDAVWRRLLERAGPRKSLPLTEDADLHVLVDGRRLDAVGHVGGVHVFHLSALPSALNVVSRAAAPGELGLARDPRMLGVALRRLVMRKGSRFQVTEASDNRLTEGFHEFEEDNGFRWTDGNAVIPAELCDGFTAPLELVVHVGATACYFADALSQHVAA